MPAPRATASNTSSMCGFRPPDPRAPTALRPEAGATTPRLDSRIPAAVAAASLKPNARRIARVDMPRARMAAMRASVRVATWLGYEDGMWLLEAG
jgi:hypothetical protein